MKRLLWVLSYKIPSIQDNLWTKITTDLKLKKNVPKSFFFHSMVIFCRRLFWQRLLRIQSQRHRYLQVVLLFVFREDVGIKAGVGPDGKVVAQLGYH